MDRFDYKSDKKTPIAEGKANEQWGNIDEECIFERRKPLQFAADERIVASSSILNSVRFSEQNGSAIDRLKMTGFDVFYVIQTTHWKWEP